MARGFKNTPRGYTAYFEKPELLLIRDLAEDIVALLQPETGQDADPLDALIGITDNPQVPTDPAVSRLLPVGSSDEEAAAEYRRSLTKNTRALGHRPSPISAWCWPPASTLPTMRELKKSTGTSTGRR